MAKQIKKTPPTKVQLTEIELLRIHNAFLQWQNANIVAQNLHGVLQNERTKAAQRLGVDLNAYTFSDEGVGTLNSPPPESLPKLPKAE